MLYCSGCDSVYTGSDRPLTCPVCKTMLVERGEEQMEPVNKDSNVPNTSNLWGWGIVLLIAGVIGYVLSAPKMNDIRSFWGQLAAGFDQGTATEFQMWQWLYYGSIVVIVIGGLLFIAGIIQQTTQKR